MHLPYSKSRAHDIISRTFNQGKQRRLMCSCVYYYPQNDTQNMALFVPRSKISLIKQTQSLLSWPAQSMPSFFVRHRHQFRGFFSLHPRFCFLLLFRVTRVFLLEFQKNGKKWKKNGKKNSTCAAPDSHVPETPLICLDRFPFLPSPFPVRVNNEKKKL